MRAGVFLRWVAHPLTVGATAVLLLNDHVFKQAWPGLVTGKLSDFAGLVVAPAVLGLLFGLFRAGQIGAAAATLLTGAGFTWVKLTGVGADVASAAWSVVNGPSVILADPGDLVALPALGLAWWVWRRTAAAPPLPDGLAHRLRVMLAVPFAVLAIAATSAPSVTLPSVDSVQVVGENVMIEADGRSYSSPSGVGDWTPLPETPLPDASSEQLPKRVPQVQACAPDDAARCYRVHGSGETSLDEWPPRSDRMLGVDETTDAGQTWHTAWEVPAARWSFVQRQHPFPGGVNRLEKLASVELAVRTVPGGHEVIVANGVEGLAVRGADGSWRRVPVVVAATGLDIRPAPITGFGQVIGDDINSAGLIILVALLIGMTVAACRARASLGQVTHHAGGTCLCPRGGSPAHRPDAVLHLEPRVVDRALAGVHAVPDRRRHRSLDGSGGAAPITYGDRRRCRRTDRPGVPRTCARLDGGPPGRARHRRRTRPDPRGGMRGPGRRDRLVGRT